MNTKITTNYYSGLQSNVTIDGAMSPVKADTDEYKDLGINKGDLVFLSWEMKPMAVLREIEADKSIDVVKLTGINPA